MQTKEAIADSMFRLLKTKSFDKITIQMLLDDSKVSKSTFYRHFGDKYELMNWCYQSYVDTLLIKVYNGKESWSNTLLLIFRFFDDNHEYFEHAAMVEGQNSFSDFLYRYSYEFYSNFYKAKSGSPTLSNEAQVALEYTCSGSVYIVKSWLARGRKESARDMSRWTFQLIPEIFRRYL